MRPENEDKMTAQTTSIMAFASALVVLMLSRPTTEKGNSFTVQTYKSAQYCVPQFDELPTAARVYCRATPTPGMPG
jgi:hypothetical protein